MFLILSGDHGNIGFYNTTLIGIFEYYVLSKYNY